MSSGPTNQHLHIHIYHSRIIRFMTNTAQPSDEIHPEFGRMLGGEAKERLLGQRGSVFWLFGLSGSGKSTLAHTVERALHERGYFTVLLDGDNLRTGLNAGLGFSDDDRRENLRRAAETAKLLRENGVVVLASFITPLESMRTACADIIGKDHFHPIYVAADFETCARRDVKGLYAKAADGKLPELTGKGSAFEVPATESETLNIDTTATDIETCAATILGYILPRIQHPLHRPAGRPAEVARAPED